MYPRPKFHLGNTKGNKDAKVSPLLTRLNVQRGQVLGAARIRAVAAVVRVIRVDEVAPAGAHDEIGRKVRTGPAGRGVKVGGLVGGTPDGLVGQGGGENAADPYSWKRISRPFEDTSVQVYTYPVSPKDVELVVRDNHAVEEGKHDEEEGQDVADDGKAGRPGADPLAPAGLEQEEEHRHEEDVARGQGVGGQARGPVPQRPVDDAGDEGARDLGQHRGGAEGDPAVDAARVLAGLPERAVHVELGQDGVKHGRRDEQDEERGEHAALHVVDGVAQLPKGEAVEDADDDGGEELAVNVRRLAPLVDEHALGQEPGLLPHGGGELVREHRVRRGRAAALPLDLLDLVDEGLVLVRDAPLLVPVLAGVGAGARLDEELGHVLALGAVGAPGGEVVDDGVAVAADGAKVEDVAAGVEREDLVKLLDELRRRLVDGAHDGLPGRAELAEEAHDGIGRLRVEAARGLVEEEQQRRLGRELDANRQPLLGLDAQRRDDGVLQLLQLEQVDHRVDVGELLVARDVAALPEERRELEGLAHRRRRLVQIHLLDEAGAPLEVGREGRAVDEHAALDDAHRLPLRQRVEQRRLAGAAGPHEGDQDAGLGVAVDVVEQLLGALRRGDRVADVFPGKHLLAAVEGLEDLVGGSLARHRRRRHVARLRVLLLVRLVVRPGRPPRRLGRLEDEGAEARAAKGHLLRGQHRQRNVPDGEGDDDAKVAPQVRPAVFKLRGQVVGSRDPGVPRM
ncbi:hypothetical protein E5D57_012816 [Metarhizium anisopliae]|nr:hypothetical protein E5D57_012816 [Metarhizium anisopliae]